MTTIEDVMRYAFEAGDMDRRMCIGKAQGFDVSSAYDALRAAIEQYAAERVAAGCNGVGDPECTYLAGCNTPCNKCGRVHRHHMMLARSQEWDRLIADRKPLTELRRMQIIGDEFPIPLVDSMVIAKVDSVARAIERAHGIGEQQNG